MLYTVLALVLAAFGLLIAALTTAETLWAWASVVVSVVAAALLITDWLKGRRARVDEPNRPTAVTVGGTRHRRDEPEPVEPAFDEQEDHFRPEPGSNLDFEPPVKAELPTDINIPDAPAAPPPADEGGDRTEVTKAVAEDSVDLADREHTDAEPGEEPTDASDLLVVAGLTAEVRVVDEHPRYHLATCVWLANRPTIPLPVGEARQLGFTPCARCAPDSVLAARHRARAK